LHKNTKNIYKLRIFVQLVYYQQVNYYPVFLKVKVY